jgi:hypothetical protein
MKALRLFSLLAIVVLMATPLSVLAQGDTGGMKEFATEDGVLTVSYPEDWFVQVNDPTSGLYGVTMANSEELLAKTFAEDESDFVAGDQAIVVFLLPTDFLSMLGMTYDPEASVVDMTQSLVDALFTTEEVAAGTATPEAPAVSDVEEVQLTDELTAGYVTVSDPTLEGAVIAFEPVDNVIAITYVLAYPGEFDDAVAQRGKDVAATIAFTGTSDDLMQIFMGNLSTDTTETPTPSASGTSLDGNALVDERCTSCHTRARIDNEMKEGMGLTEWTAVVDRMIGYGAQLNADERQAVLDYLTAK